MVSVCELPILVWSPAIQEVRPGPGQEEEGSCRCGLCIPLHYVYYILLYNIYNITTLFVGCKQGGRSKHVSNNFDPCVFFPDGEGYMYVRPLLRQKPCPGRFTFRGGESPYS